MKKVIVIDNCNKCPNRDHKGAFGVISYIPRCKLTGEELPFTLGNSSRVVVAVATGVIPDTCPLDNFPEPEPFLQK